ncbi:MAG: hypothetical protein QXP39_02770 [Candidatus Aenigmatarchaeota archaeon]
MKMRGVAQEILLIVLVVMGIIMFLLAFQAEKFVRTEERMLQEDTYTLLNSLKAAKAYIETSLIFSTYQACYDVLKTMPSSETSFVESIKNRIKENLAVYTSEDYVFMEGYQVKLPQYEISITDVNENNIKVVAVPLENISVSKSYSLTGLVSKDIKLEKDGLVVKTIEMPCLSIFNFAKANAANFEQDERTRFESKISTLPKRLPKDSKKYPKAVFEGIDMKNLNDVCKKVLEIEGYSLDEYEKDLVKSIEEKEGNIVIKKGIKNVKIMPLITGIYPVSENGWIRVECNFEYKIDAVGEVVIESQDRYPVFNGTEIAFSPLIANYTFNLVKS